MLVQRVKMLLLVGIWLVIQIANPVTAELVGYWPLDEGEGETVADHSGNDLTGYIQGDTEWFEGKFGSALFFGGDFDHVRVPDESDAIDETSNDNIENLRFSSEDSFTAMAWVYIPEEAGSGWQGVVTKSRDTSPTEWWGLWIDGESHWAYGHNGNHLRGGSLGLDPVEEGWTHFAIQQNADEETLIMYIDGENVGEWAGVEPQDGPGDLVFGGAGGITGCCDNEWFVGGVDEVRIYNTAISEEEIQAAMMGPDTDPLAPLDNGTISDPAERAEYVHNVLETWIGDSNLDGEFNSADLVAIFQAGEYEDNVVGNSSWVTGDWNGDKEFGSGDLVAAFQDGGFELGPRNNAASAVPEPGSCVLLAIGFLSTLALKRRSDS